jgi:hypothetical protein
MSERFFYVAYQMGGNVVDVMSARGNVKYG